MHYYSSDSGFLEYKAVRPHTNHTTKCIYFLANNESLVPAVGTVPGTRPGPWPLRTRGINICSGLCVRFFGVSTQRWSCWLVWSFQV